MKKEKENNEKVLKRISIRRESKILILIDEIPRIIGSERIDGNENIPFCTIGLGFSD